MIEFCELYQRIYQNNIYTWNNISSHGKFKQWCYLVEDLPAITPTSLDLINGLCAKIEPNLLPNQLNFIEKMLRTLMPWRKGPFSLYGIIIDSEWRSAWKWNRLLPHIAPLSDRTVLDVGCGNGYYLWRMVGAGARLAVGIDPTLLFFFQFEAVRKLLGSNQQAQLLPIGIENLPKLAAFDTVFSMGVLYHRHSPIEHIFQLKNQLVPNGELVLETLIVEGNANQVLPPNTRYAKMRNIYFIPTALELKCWLERCGFIDVKIVDLCMTSTKEQRRTSWMISESLEEFLDPNNHYKTVEGYPAPVRAILVAKNPD